MVASFQYLLATTQEIVRKEKTGKVSKKRHPTSLHDYKTEKPKHKLEKDRVEKDNEQKYFHCATVNMSPKVISTLMIRTSDLGAY